MENVLMIHSFLTMDGISASYNLFQGFFLKIIPFIIVLGLLIFFHELGHFLAAKFFKVKVERFSFGLGPRLFGLKVGETDYRVSAFPLGGYVKMVGEGLEEEVPAPERERSFSHKPPWKRIVIVFCGPLFNFLFAVAVFFLVFWLIGQPVLTNQIGEVKADFPAARAGLQQGDRILRIDGKPIQTWSDLPELIRQNPGRNLEVVFQRGEKQYSTQVTPVRSSVKNIFGESVEETVIGVSPSGESITRKQGFLESLGDGVVQTWNVTKMTVLSLIKLVQRKLPLETLGGPIFIAQLAGQQAQEGWMNLIFFTALLSVNLAILNLLPIPILDGGHLLFFGLEWIMGRPVSLKMREMAQQVGLFILILLMIFIFYNDIVRIAQ